MISQALLAVYKCSCISLLVIDDEDLKIFTCYFFDELSLMQGLQLQMILQMLPFASTDSWCAEMIIFFCQIDKQS